MLLIIIMAKKNYKSIQFVGTRSRSDAHVTHGDLHAQYTRGPILTKFSLAMDRPLIGPRVTSHFSWGIYYLGLPPTANFNHYLLENFFVLKHSGLLVLSLYWVFFNGKTIK